MLAPCSINKSNYQPKHENDDLVFNTEVIEQIYMIYKEYIASFSPNLNQNQILLYIYKQFFNTKNVSFTNEFSK